MIKSNQNELQKYSLFAQTAFDFVYFNLSVDEWQKSVGGWINILLLYKHFFLKTAF